MKIGLWMYENEGGDLIKKTLTKRLKDCGFEVFPEIDLNSVYIFNGSVYDPEGWCLNELDVIFAMNADQQSNLQTDSLKMLELNGTTILNSTSSFERAHDKFLANNLLRQSGIIVPDSILIGKNWNQNLLESMMKRWGQFLLKPRRNHGGKGILKFDCLEHFQDFQSATEMIFDDYYLEQFIPFDKSDLRVEILNNQFIGGYSRQGLHSFKTNVAAGANIRAIEIPEDVQNLALRCCQILELEGSIVDIIKSSLDHQYYVIEVNPQLGIFIESAITCSPKFRHDRNIGDFCGFDQRKIDAIIHRISSLKKIGGDQ